MLFIKRVIYATQREEAQQKLLIAMYGVCLVTEKWTNQSPLADLHLRLEKGQITSPLLLTVIYSDQMAQLEVMVKLSRNSKVFLSAQDGTLSKYYGVQSGMVCLLEMPIKFYCVDLPKPLTGNIKIQDQKMVTITALNSLILIRQPKLQLPT